MKKVFRHGEILLVKAKEIPKEAKLKKTDTLLVGSGQNPHTFKGGSFYELKNDYIFGYLKAKHTKLFHLQHGDKKSGGLLEAKLPNGIYELRQSREVINEELRPIID